MWITRHSSFKKLVFNLIQYKSYSYCEPLIQTFFRNSNELLIIHISQHILKNVQILRRVYIDVEMMKLQQETFVHFLCLQIVYNLTSDLLSRLFEYLKSIGKCTIFFVSCKKIHFKCTFCTPGYMCSQPKICT